MKNDNNKPLPSQKWNNLGIKLTLNAIINEHWLINEIQNVIVLTNYYYWKFESIVDMKYAYVINSPISYKKTFMET